MSHATRLNNGVTINYDGSDLGGEVRIVWPDGNATLTEWYKIREGGKSEPAPEPSATAMRAWKEYCAGGYVDPDPHRRNSRRDDFCAAFDRHAKTLEVLRVLKRCEQLVGGGAYLDVCDLIRLLESGPAKLDNEAKG